MTKRKQTESEASVLQSSNPFYHTPMYDRKYDMCGTENMLTPRRNNNSTTNTEKGEVV